MQRPAQRGRGGAGGATPAKPEGLDLVHCGPQAGPVGRGRPQQTWAGARGGGGNTRELFPFPREHSAEGRGSGGLKRTNGVRFPPGMRES